MKILHILTALAAGMAAGVWLGECGGPGEEAPGECRADTTRYIDTVRYLMPQAKRETELGVRVIYLPMPSAAEADSQRQTICGDGLPVAGAAEADGQRQTACGDGLPVAGPDFGVEPDSGMVAVEIPITQKEYEGEDYRAWVSGYAASLDSIMVYRREDVVRVKRPPKRWHVGPCVGVGAGPCGAGLFWGVSVTYSILSF